MQGLICERRKIHCSLEADAVIDRDQQAGFPGFLLAEVGVLQTAGGAQCLSQGFGRAERRVGFQPREDFRKFEQDQRFWVHDTKKCITEGNDG